LADGDIQYRAFISYSQSDRLVADWLHHALVSYRIPTKLVGRETAVGPVPHAVKAPSSSSGCLGWLQQSFAALLPGLAVAQRFWACRQAHLALSGSRR
jgi:hypothetical protein